MPIRIVSEPIPVAELRQIASEQFGDFVKAVVDVRRGVVAIGGSCMATKKRCSWTTAADRRTCGGSISTPTDPGGSGSNSTR